MIPQLPGAEAGVVCPEKHVPQERLARDSTQSRYCHYGQPARPGHAETFNSIRHVNLEYAGYWKDLP